MMRTCRQCKNYLSCKREAEENGEEFDPDFDGEELCGDSMFQPMTNADKIRAMTDEELAIEMFVGMECGACPCADKCGNGAYCKDTILEWLKQPAEDDC